MGRRYEISEHGLGIDVEMDRFIETMPSDVSEHTGTTKHEYCEGPTLSQALVPYLLRYALLTSWEEAEALIPVIRYSRPHWKHYLPLTGRQREMTLVRFREWQKEGK